MGGGAAGCRRRLSHADADYRDLPTLAGCVTAAIASAFVFMRFGYLYAAFAAAACAALSAFNLGLSRDVERILSACILLVIFAVARTRAGHTTRSFAATTTARLNRSPGSASMRSSTCSCRFRRSAGTPRGRPDFSSAFYWSTYAAIWLLPAIGLALAVRDKHRMMLWASTIMVVATLATNKPYLGWNRQTWDPILFGILLVAVATGVRRWLLRASDGHRRGFTPLPLVVSADRQALDVLGTVAVAAQPFEPRMSNETPAVEPGRGGRSGGAGGGADF